MENVDSLPVDDVCECGECRDCENRKAAAETLVPTEAELLELRERKPLAVSVLSQHVERIEGQQRSMRELLEQLEAAMQIMRSREAVELMSYRMRQSLVDKLLLSGFEWMEAADGSSAKRDAAEALQAAVVELSRASIDPPGELPEIPFGKEPDA